MRFNPKARLDTSRVRDRGRAAGRGGGGLGGGLGGGGIPIPGGLAGGGGVIGLIIAVVIYVIATQVGGGSSSSSYDTSRMQNTDRYANCETGADANSSSDCARVAVENSLYSYWSKTLGSKFHPEAGVDTFGNAIQTGCGQATSDVGPFYCPNDQTIYLDTTFFEAVLQGQLAGPSGAFVEPYVLAHEYGHHIQNLLGTMSRVKTQQGPKSDSVRLELQADCYAGMWAKGATTTVDADGNVLFESISDEDIKNAIDAATAVGDDRIQEESGGKVNPEQWTHGSSAERVHWFQTGFQTDSLDACDTFASNAL